MKCLGTLVMHEAASLLGIPPNHLITPQNMHCNYLPPLSEEGTETQRGQLLACVIQIVIVRVRI